MKYWCTTYSLHPFHLSSEKKTHPLWGFGMELSPSLAASNSVVRASEGSEAQMGCTRWVCGWRWCYSGWWQVEDFWNFHPECLGFHDPIWWSHIFSNGLVQPNSYWLVSFFQKFYWDKLQLKVSLGLMISMGNFAFGALGLGLKFFFAENGRGFLKDGSLEKVVGWCFLVQKWAP